ncbi:MAG: phosphohydrolase [Desulfobulbaceae bacterium A2]|nr:MAG: phosphohydrolase [Desulfobulbaceae bacterium A2]
MNEQPLGEALTHRLISRCLPYYEGGDGSHDLDHVERVHRNALFLGERLGARLDILSAAALLHDIGRPEESASKGAICHAARGAELAEPILRQLNFGTQDIELVLHCIRAHRYRGATRPETLEARILFDADKLDSIGAIGIGRAFLFAGRVGARLHNPELDPALTKSYSQEDTAYREFQVKLRRVQDRMLTPAGQELARVRHTFMEDFFAQLNREFLGPGADTSDQFLSGEGGTNP